MPRNKVLEVLPVPPDSQQSPPDFNKRAELAIPQDISEVEAEGDFGDEADLPLKR